MPFFDSAPLLVATGNNEKNQIKSKVIAVKNSMMKTVNTDMGDREPKLPEEEKVIREATTTTTTTTAAGIIIVDAILSDGVADIKKGGAKKSAIADDRERREATCRALAKKIIKR